MKKRLQKEHKQVSTFREETLYTPISRIERSKFDHNALWSVPSSGNHWVRFIVEYLTAYPTHGHGRSIKDPPIFMNTFPSSHHPLAHVKKSRRYILYKSHIPYPLTEKSTLLLLVRDFYEYLGRGGAARDILMYIDLLVAYDIFAGTKMLIYYEDLILEPEREIRRIKHFFDATEVFYKDFMRRYDYYSTLSRQGENRKWAGSKSGSDIQFHQNRLSKKVMVERIESFHEFLEKAKYQQVKPYIARYIH